MPVQSTERAWITARVPKNYRSRLLARAEMEDRSMSSLVRSALSAYLFTTEAELRASANSVETE
jgi:hypothetical protein